MLTALNCILTFLSLGQNPEICWQREETVVICLNQASAEKWRQATLFSLGSSNGARCQLYPEVLVVWGAPVSITSDGRERSIVIYEVTVPNSEILLRGSDTTLKNEEMEMIEAYMLKEVPYVSL